MLATIHPFVSRLLPFTFMSRIYTFPDFCNREFPIMDVIGQFDILNLRFNIRKAPTDWGKGYTFI